MSGFLVPLPSIPGWWLWFYYISPVAWTLRGIISSQLDDVEEIISGPGFEGTVEEYLESKFSTSKKDDETLKILRNLECNLFLA
ncbi:hypothetical protein K7X08_002214 [Anisodus acutangulus]|uniref:ABC-2 type transporter transmembrane domain-containing protein n=1 Tax=Anisodus acutangulus TaxID=402998 RepID=A0A9Q1R598_9SOLA|nr:hypothetical protein K7X08_002214 [Anisodus acutangulus]